ncbi:sgmD [Symbiodinium sp. CCMP2456]|nr:sgmD [Symbiodinium sp. CCMP2456]
MTDLHGDPHYATGIRQCRKRSLHALQDQTFGLMGCDPPIALGWSAASAAQATEQPKEFLLYTGDFSRHTMGLMPNTRASVSNIIGDVASVFKAHFPKIPLVMGALGNDDGPQNYFQTITSDEPANDWFVLVGAKLNSSWSMTSDAVKQYSYGGYFEARVGNLTLLSIATVIYSVRHRPTQLEEDPFSQFAWLSSRLKEAAHEGRSVWIVGHIPPGIETFGYTELWHPMYLSRYLEIVQDSLLGSVIAAQLFGHVHKDEFRILPNPPPGAGPILLSSALSPVYYNNPAFKVVKYCKSTGKLLDFETFFSKVAEQLDWQSGYCLNSTFPGFGAGGLVMEDFLRLRDKLLLGLEDFEKYAKWYTSDYPADLSHLACKDDDTVDSARSKLLRRHQYGCGLMMQNQEDYQRCFDRAIASTSTQHHAAQPLFRVSRLLESIPKEFEDIETFRLSKLLRWAEVAKTQQALEVLNLAYRSLWEELLQKFGPAVERALETGGSLDSEISGLSR